MCPRAGHRCVILLWTKTPVQSGSTFHHGAVCFSLLSPFCLLKQGDTSHPSSPFSQPWEGRSFQAEAQEGCRGRLSGTGITWAVLVLAFCSISTKSPGRPGQALGAGSGRRLPWVGVCLCT